MKLGIFTRTFSGTLDEVLDAVVAHGLACAHFNFRSSGLAALPDEPGEDVCVAVRDAFERRGLQMAAISGTFNAIDPDRTARQRDIRRAGQLIQMCGILGTKLVSLCTGTRTPDDMWRGHPDNAKPDAWSDLLATLDALLPIAEANGVSLGIEPEQANVVDSAAKARRLLDEVKSKRLRIILDGANLFDPHAIGDMPGVLKEAFDLLGPDIENVHAKDITGDETKKDQAAGTGLLDWPSYFRLMKDAGFDGPVVLHNLGPPQVAGCVEFVRRQAAPWYPEAANP